MIVSLLLTVAIVAITAKYVHKFVPSWLDSASIASITSLVAIVFVTVILCLN